MKNPMNRSKNMATVTTLESRGAFVVPSWEWRNVAPALKAATARSWAWSWGWMNGWRERWSNWSWNGSNLHR
jgi:hypothetical protein